MKKINRRYEPQEGFEPPAYCLPIFDETFFKSFLQGNCSTTELLRPREEAENLIYIRYCFSNTLI